MKSNLFRATALVAATLLGVSSLSSAVDGLLNAPHITSVGVIYFGAPTAKLIVAQPNGSDCAAGQYVSSISPTTGLPSCASGVTSGHGFGYLDSNNTTSGNNTHSGSETFNGATTAVTQSTADSSTKLATTANVDAKIASQLGAGRKLIKTTIANQNDSTIVDTTSFSSTYSEYSITIENCTSTSPGTTTLSLFVYTAGSLRTSGYQSFGYQVNASGGLTGTGNITSGIPLSANNVGGGAPLTSYIRFPNPTGTTYPKLFDVSSNYLNSTPIAIKFVSTGAYTTDSFAVSGISINWSAGNFVAGCAMKVYGEN